MKRVYILLVLCLVLCGCGQKADGLLSQEDVTAEEWPETWTETDPFIEAGGMSSADVIQQTQAASLVVIVPEQSEIEESVPSSDPASFTGDNTSSAAEQTASEHTSPESAAPETTETEIAEVTGKTEALSGEADPAEGEPVRMDMTWKYADYSQIRDGEAMLYRASANRKNIVVGVNAGHGTSGGSSVKTYCHPDKTPKVTGGTTSEGAVKAVAVSSGMDFADGTSEARVNLKVARYLKNMLLEQGYDVLMIRDGNDVQLDNIARTLLCNHAADCHVAIHFDGDELGYDKGCFFMSVPDGLKTMEPVASVWREDEALGRCLIDGLRDQGMKIFGDGTLEQDLTQTAFSTVPSVDIELGNESSDIGNAHLKDLAGGLMKGIRYYFES